MTGQSFEDITGVFREIANLLVHTPELDAALSLTLSSVRRLFPESALALYRYWPDSDELEVIAVAPEGGIRSLLGTRLPIQVGTRLAVGRWRPGQVVRSGNAVHLPSTALDEDAGPLVDLLCVPIHGLGRRVVGVLQTISQRPYTFTDDNLKTLRAVAAMVALAEENVRRGQALQSTTASQVYAEHIAAMADMTSHMAHRIVNEMGAIRLALQVLRRQREGGELTNGELLETLEGINQNAEDTIALVRRIKRPFDRIETAPVHPDTVLGDVLAQLCLPDDVTLVRQSEPDLPPVLATPQLAEVFHHLIRNALDAMSTVAEKRLTVTARRQGDDQVEVSFQDSGPGVPDHLRADLFRLGVTDKRNGLGYGLWWSRLYLARIGGSLEMDPSARQGARFVVRLRTATDEGRQG